METRHRYLLCDGSRRPVSEFPELYQVIGDHYSQNEDDAGEDDFFEIPDLRGQFLRGVGTAHSDAGFLENRTVLPNAVVADRSVQTQSIQSHTHGVKDGVHAENCRHIRHHHRGIHDRFGQNMGRNSPGVGSGRSDVDNNCAYTWSHSTEASGTSETRPKNVAVHWFIRF